MADWYAIGRKPGVSNEMDVILQLAVNGPASVDAGALSSYGPT